MIRTTESNKFGGNFGSCWKQDFCTDAQLAYSLTFIYYQEASNIGLKVNMGAYRMKNHGPAGTEEIGRWGLASERKQSASELQKECRRNIEENFSGKIIRVINSQLSDIPDLMQNIYSQRYLVGLSISLAESPKAIN